MKAGNKNESGKKNDGELKKNRMWEMKSTERHVSTGFTHTMLLLE